MDNENVDSAKSMPLSEEGCAQASGDTSTQANTRSDTEVRRMVRTVLCLLHLTFSLPPFYSVASKKCADAFEQLLCSGKYAGFMSHTLRSEEVDMLGQG